MKTVLIEKKIDEKGDFVLSEETNRATRKVVMAIMILVVLIVACLFMHPLLVFGIAGLISLAISVYRFVNEIKQTEYDLGNDLLDYQSLEEFRKDYER